MKYSFSNNFKSVINDYFYLLEKKYTVKSILKLISDRYRLSAVERSILLRGITSKELALNRKNKLLSPENIYGKILNIDFFNVIFTINSYLNGILVYHALDHCLRDVSESHGVIKNKQTLNKTIDLLIIFLKKLNLIKSFFYIDSPISFSKKLSDSLKINLTKNNINNEILLVKSADHYLSLEKKIICATSDSTIIDKVEKVFDLAFYVLNENYKKPFLDLKKFIE